MIGAKNSFKKYKSRYANDKNNIVLAKGYGFYD